MTQRQIMQTIRRHPIPPKHKNLFVWNCAAGKGRVLDASGSLASVPEVARGDAHAMRQLTVTNQPDSDVNGAAFPLLGSETIGTDVGTGPTLNGANGAYFGCLVNVNPLAGVEANNVQFRTASSTSAGRLYTVFNWAKQLYIYGKPDDISTVLYGHAPAISYGVWTFIEVELLLGAGGHVKVWYDGVQQVVTAENPTATAAFPLSDSSGFYSLPDTESNIAAFVASNGILPANVRQLVSDYGNTLRENLL